MAEVWVGVADAAARRLPPVCAMSGRPAAGAMPMRLPRTGTRLRGATIRVPLSQDVFSRWSVRRSLEIRARTVATILGAIGVVLAFRSLAPAMTAFVAAGLAHAVSLWAAHGLGALQPGVEPQSDRVLLTGVHPDFVAAITSHGLDKPPRRGSGSR